MDQSHFTARYKIRFSHCDPAGIVYFPQYLVLSNHLVEDWFDHGLGIPFAALIGVRRVGLPIVRIECDFLRPSRMGEQLDFDLTLQRLGRRSITVSIAARQMEEVRIRATQVMAATSLDSGTSIDVPADIARALNDLRGAVA